MRIRFLEVAQIELYQAVEYYNYKRETNGKESKMAKNRLLDSCNC